MIIQNQIPKPDNQKNPQTDAKLNYLTFHLQILWTLSEWIYPWWLNNKISGSRMLFMHDIKLFQISFSYLLSFILVHAFFVRYYNLNKFIIWSVGMVTLHTGLCLTKLTIQYKKIEYNISEMFFILERILKIFHQLIGNMKKMIFSLRSRWNFHIGKLV